MASLIEEILDVLEETTGCYDDLLQLADNKKDVIIKGDVPSLQTLTDHEQGVAGRLLRLEKKRMQLIQDVCLVTNRENSSMTIHQLIELLTGQEEEQAKLRDVSNRMMTVVEQVRVKNDLNKELLKESLEFVNFTMNAIQSVHDINTGNGYEKQGNRYEGSQNVNFFDAKQ